ncbi:hypothetical protein GCM10017744_103570 [Streptomyces antimycoticus]
MEVGVETAQAVSAAVGKLPRMDELTRRRVYGADHEDPRTAAGKRLPELVAGPLDGLLPHVTRWTDERLREEASL